MAHPRIEIAPNDDPRWRLARDGDLVARNSLVEEHIRLLDQVSTVVCHNLPDTVDRDDIRSFGAFGLIRAVETYDPEIASFRTHAVFLIKARIYDELRSADWAPKSVRKRIRELTAASRELVAAGAEPSTEALAEALEISVDQVRAAQTERRLVNVESLYDTSCERAVVEGPESAASVAGYLEDFSQWVGSLTEEEQAVWSLRFYCGLTTQQTAVMLGVPSAAVTKASSRIFQSFRRFVDNTLVG